LGFVKYVSDKFEADPDSPVGVTKRPSLAACLTQTVRRCDYVVSTER
jgi:hypothetical protein